MHVLSTLYTHEATDVTEVEATQAVCDGLGERFAPMALAVLLAGVSARDPSRVGTVLDGVLQEAGSRGVDPMPLLVGVGRLAVGVAEPTRSTLVDVIRALAAKRPLDRDDRIRELAASLAPS